MTTPESRTVEERLADVLHVAFDGPGAPDPGWTEIASSVLAAAKEHGLVIEEGERLEGLQSAAGIVVAATNGSHDTMASHDHSKCLPWALDMLRAALEESRR